MREICRCGWDPRTGDHLCHRCGKAPGSSRFYGAPIGTFSLAGAMLKVSASETNACDGCWQEFVTEMRFVRVTWFLRWVVKLPSSQAAVRFRA